MSDQKTYLPIMIQSLVHALRTISQQWIETRQHHIRVKWRSPIKFALMAIVAFSSLAACSKDPAHTGKSCVIAETENGTSLTEASENCQQICAVQFSDQNSEACVEGVHNQFGAYVTCDMMFEYNRDHPFYANCTRQMATNIKISRDEADKRQEDGQDEAR